jgi:hypothetical protein
MKPGRLERVLLKHGTALFMTFMLAAVVPLLAYQTEFNAPFDLAFKTLTVPIVALCFYVYRFHMPQFRAESSTLKGVMLTALFAALIVLMSGSYVLLANAWGPGQREILLEGRITELYVHRGRHTTSYLVTLVVADGSSTQVEVQEDEFARLRVGGRYSQPWTVGALGILYR